MDRLSETENLAFAPGDFLAEGKYEIIKLVGAGAMGQVYKAFHTALGRTVAIKVLHSEMTRDPKASSRFQREARAASKLAHPNSMEILDFGSQGRLFYIVMEFLEGRELTDIIRTQAPLPLERIVHLMSQALAALSAAHEQGVIHRDFKPDNVMILSQPNDDGHVVEKVKVCDFGIAKIQSHGEFDTQEASKITEAGSISGTPAYMSPEQCRGLRLDARSDLYAAGIVLFEMATGVLPFAAETLVGLLMQHINDPPPRPTTIVSSISPELEAIVLRCLEKDPAARFAGARELRQALRELPSEFRRADSDAPLDARQSSLRPTSPRTSSPVPGIVGEALPDGAARKRHYRWPIAVALFVAAALTAGFFAFREQHPARPAAAMRKKVTTALAGPEIGLSADVPNASPEGASRAIPEEPASNEPVPQPDEPTLSTMAAAPRRTGAPSWGPASRGPAAARAQKKAETEAPSPTASKQEDVLPYGVSPPLADTEKTDAAPRPLPVAPEPKPAATTPSAVQETPAKLPSVQPARQLSLEASAAVRIVSINGSLAAAPIRQGINQIVGDLRSCYKDAARRAGRDAADTVHMQVTINEDGWARQPSARGATLPGLDACLVSVAAKIRSRTQPDTGVVYVVFDVLFSPKQ